MTLAEELQDYKKQYNNTGILTIYLNTDFGDGDQHSGEWRIRLKNGLKKLKEYVEKSGSKEELKAYKKLADKADQHIHDKQSQLQKSYIFMASANGEFFVEKILQVPVDTAFHWEKEPVLDQLERINSRFPAAGIIMVQKSDVLFIDTASGEIKDELNFNWDIDTEDWKQYEGNSATERISSGSTQVDEVQRRFDENRQRWYKNLAPILDKESKKRKLQGVYLVGSKEYTREIENHLGTKILDTISKNLISKPTHEVVNIVYGAEVR